MRIRCLGPLGVSAPAQTGSLGGPKQRLVLAHLLIRANQTVPTETLITAVWDDDPPKAARSSLQSYISHLRKMLGAERITGDGHGYALSLITDEVDALQFERLVADGRQLRTDDPQAARDVLREALALWTGPPFADLGDAPSLQAEIARLDELRRTAIEDRIAADLDAGEDTALIGELETLTAEHPLRERLWGQLMIALYRAGRQGEALAAFDRARALLADELGVDPSPDLRALHTQVLRQDPSLRSPRRTLRGYQLIERIGANAFGEAWRATRPDIDRDVVIIAAPAARANDAEFIRAFDAHAQRIAGIEHPHVVPVYDFWREPDGAYLVVRHVRGGTLRDRLSDSSARDHATALRAAAQLTQALAVTHQRGVVHGDIRPANVLFDDQGNSYLAGTGLAAFGDAPVPVDAVRYVAPERAGGAELDPRVDVYALGMLLRDVVGDGDAAVAGVIGRATAQDPSERPRDGGELLAELWPSLSSPPHSDTPAADVRAPAVRNPYKGLRAFMEGDAGDFFGRDAVVARLLARLREAGSTARFLTLVGPSGSGKSSVIRAGLVPALRTGALDGSDAWFVVQTVPGRRPFDELATALRGVAVTPPRDLADRLRDEHAPAVIAELLPSDGELLVIVDQFEELFMLVDDDDERQRFIDLLVDAVTAPDAAVRVVVTLRADFFDRPLQVGRLGALMQARTETLLPLTAGELERAVAEPAERVGVEVERTLVTQMVADVRDQPGALPLLQYALTELFDARDDRALTASSYRTIGGVTGALARRADTIHAGLTDAGRDAARQLFLRLVTPGEGVEDTRRRALVTDVNPLAPDAMPGVLSAFGDARLLSFDRDPATRVPTVEVAHEALLREWPLLRGWIDTARDDLRIHRRLEAAAADWLEADRDRSYLAGGSQLTQYESWRDGAGMTTTGRERDYLEASIAARDRALAEEAARQARERDLERRSVRRLRVLVAVLGVAALVAGALTVVATTQSRRAADEARRAERGERVATARELAAAADTNLDVDPERSMLLAMAAIDATRASDGTVLREAEEALHRAVHTSRTTLRVPDVGGFLDWSPDGSVFVTEGPEGAGVIDLRDATTGQSLRAWKGHEIDINDVAFGPDGTTLATAGDDGALRLWDVGTGDLVAEHAQPMGDADHAPVRGLAFSPNGDRVAGVWMNDDELRVVAVDTGDVISSVTEVGAPFFPFRTAFSPDGRELVVPSFGRQRGFIIDPDTGEERRQLGPGTITTVAWSPDGRWVAGTEGSDALLFDAATGAVRFTLVGHTAEIRDLDWMQDSTRLATGSGDGTVTIWDVDARGVAEALVLGAEGMSGGVQGVAVSPDGRRVMGGEGVANGVVVWDIERISGGEWSAFPSTMDGNAWDPLVVAPDGQHVLTADATGTVTMWDPTDGRRIREYGGDPPAWLLSTGEDVIAAGLADGRVTVWDAESGDVRYRVPSGDLNDVAASADGRFVAASYWEGPARVFDRSGTQIAELPLSADHSARAIALSPDGALAAVAEEPLRPDGRGHVRLWRVADREVVHTFERRPTNLDFSTDGTRLAISLEDGETTVWDVHDGTSIATLTGHAGPVWSVTFSADGATIATTGRDSTVRLWDAETGSPRLVLPGQDDLATGAAFTADGRMLASAGQDGAARVWALDLDDLIGIAQDKLTRALTEAECREYLHVDACPTS